MSRKQAMSKAEWQRIVLAFESSNQSIDSFCTAHNLVRGTFTKWYYKLRKHSQTNILPVQLSSPIAPVMIGISFPNGSRLEFDSNLPVTYATILIREVRQC
jgi:hypothetical protein